MGTQMVLLGLEAFNNAGHYLPGLRSYFKEFRSYFLAVFTINLDFTVCSPEQNSDSLCIVVLFLHMF